MSVRDVLLWPDVRLSKVCEPVEVADPQLIEDLLDTMYAAYGRGLAAPQVGVLQRVFVVDVTWKEGPRDPRVFINPVVQDSGEDMRSMEEQCLSIPNVPMDVARPSSITMTWDTPEGRQDTGTFEGTLARCILHELDHLDGRVIFDHQTPKRRAELEAAYAG